ncbi:MAG: BON domain-containing protein [Bryobacterales bacterium]|nr:BON domain-containing protein [Bryobacterales bacterium]
MRCHFLTLIGLGFLLAGCANHQQTGAATDLTMQGSERAANRSAQGVGAAAEGVQQNLKDDAIATAVKAKLTAGSLFSLTSIDVNVKAGEVVLSGRVDSEAEKQKAGEEAIRVAGVRRVQNNLEVSR